jgi:hypothetical protein
MARPALPDRVYSLRSPSPEESRASGIARTPRRGQSVPRPACGGAIPSRGDSGHDAALRHAAA